MTATMNGVSLLTSPLIDSAAITQALRLIVGDGNVTEIRCLEAYDDNPRWTKTFAGFFDDPDAAASELARLKGAKGIYFVPNPVDPALLARASNRLKVQPKGDSTSDGNIMSRRWLLIDCDALRPAGISASDSEHDAAIAKADEIREHLGALGWPTPLLADSGNGAHLLYRIDLPCDDAGSDTALVKRVLESLAEDFDGQTVKVDTSVHNRSRIWKLYGSKAGKGDDIAERPHRMARIIDVPDELSVVSLEQLEQLAKPVVPAPVTKSSVATYSNGEFDLESFISAAGLQITGPHQKADSAGGQSLVWELTESPLCEHGGDGPFLIRRATGAIVAGCHHDSCSWGWADLRSRFDSRPERTDRRRIQYADPALRDLDPSAPPTPEPSSDPPPRWQSFPIEVLPGPIAGYCKQVAEAVQVDISMVALPALVCAASAIGESREIEVSESWREPATLWGGVVSPSGGGKTPSAQKVVRPTRQRDSQQQAENAIALQDHQQALEEHKSAVDKWKTDSKKGHAGEMPVSPEPPAMLRSSIADITPEALASVLGDNPRGVLCERDELSGFLGGFGRYSNGKGEAERGQYLSIWSADRITIDRKTGSPRTITIDRPLVSIYGGLQPDLLNEVFSKQDIASGLPARFLWTMPPVRKRLLSRATISQDAEDAYAATVAGLYSLQPGDDGPQRVRLDDAAWEVFRTFHDELSHREADSHGPIVAALSKLKSYALRLALVIHCLKDRCGDIEFGAEGTVSAETMAAATTLADWFSNEAARVFAIRSESPQDADRRALVDWLHRHDGEATPAELARSGPRRYRGHADQAELALNDLATAGQGEWTTKNTGPSGGRPTRFFRVLGVERKLNPHESAVLGGLRIHDLPETANSETDWEGTR